MLSLVVFFCIGFATVIGDGCHRITDWSYIPPEGNDLDIFGIKYEDKAANNVAFTLTVHGADGNKVCKEIQAGELEPEADGWIYAYCEGGSMVGKYVSVKSHGLRVCGKDIWMIAQVKSQPCDANSKRIGGKCHCNSGYTKSGNECLKDCPENSRRSGRKCVCNSGYVEQGPDCVKASSGCLGSGGIITVAVDAGSARQSDVSHSGQPMRAVDGNRAGHWNSGSCTHTHAGRQVPWWSVQFKKRSLVQYVEIQNRIDCCAHRLANFHIMVDDQPCTFHGNWFHGRKRIYCDHPVCGSKLTIKLSNNREPLTLCDVQIYGQRIGGSPTPKCSAPEGSVVIGLKPGTARQSDMAHGGSASRAVDGNRGGYWSINTCTHTHAGRQIPWWSVQFSQMSLVRAVEIQNRMDCCSNRLNNFYIMVDDKRCKYHGGSFNGRKRITCDTPVCGTTLTIKLPTNKAPLTLCDVQVFGQPLGRRSQASKCNGSGGIITVPLNGGSAQQSDQSHGGVASRAVDGNRDGHWSSASCTHTHAHRTIPWWSVNFRQKALVKYVEIQNRIDCCPSRLANFHIMVDNQRCTFHGGWFHGRKRIYCDHPVCGSKLTIKLSTNAHPLTLCDVQVYGQRIGGSPAPKCSSSGGSRVIPLKPDTARQTDVTHGGLASRAVDQNRGGHWHTNTCTHTSSGRQTNWWSIDFRQRSLVQAVEIQNRVDCCANRLTNFYIMVDDQVCKFHAGSFNNRKRISCDRPVCGNTLTIKLSTNRQPLTLCDVRVIGWIQN